MTRVVTYKNGKQQIIKGQMIIIHHNKRINVYEVHLRKNGKRKCFKIHRLVANAFIENDDPENKTTVNHIDGNRANNCVENLEWMTYSDNEKHSYDELHRPINRPKYMKRRCESIEKDSNTKTVYESIEAASRDTGVSASQIRRIASGECVNHKYDFIIEGMKK